MKEVFGLLFAFVAMFCWGVGDFLIQKSTRKIGDVESLAFIGIIGSIFLIPFVITDLDLIFTPSNLFLLLVLGVITFVAALFDFEALKKGKLSIVDVLIELELPVTIILGFVFFKESLSLAQFAVISLIFIGIVMIATKSFSHWKTRLEKGVFLALIAAVGMSFINFLTAFSSRQISPLMAIWFPWMVVSIMCLIYIVKREGMSKFIKNGIKFKKLIFFMGIFDTLAWLFYAFAIHNNNLSFITSITESYPAIALMLGVLINKEKINWHQYVGAVLSISASLTLAFLI